MKPTLYTYADTLTLIRAHSLTMQAGAYAARNEYLATYLAASWFRRLFDRRLRAWGQRTERLVELVETNNEREDN